MVNNLSIGKPVDSTQVQEVKSITGTPVGWAFVNEGCVSFALSSRKIKKLESQISLASDYFGEGGPKLTKATLQNLVRVMVHLPESFIERVKVSESPIPTKDGSFGIMKMAQPRYTDYEGSQPQIHKDDYITPYPYYPQSNPNSYSFNASDKKRQTQVRDYYNQYLKDNYSKTKNPFSPPHKSDFYSEYPPLPAYFKQKYDKRTVMIDLNLPSIDSLLSSDWKTGFHAEGCQWLVFSVPLPSIQSLLSFKSSTHPLTFIKTHATKKPPINFLGLFNWLNLRKC